MRHDILEWLDKDQEGEEGMYPNLKIEQIEQEFGVNRVVARDHLLHWLRLNTPNVTTEADINTFVSAYIAAALFSGVEPPEDHPLKDRDMVYDLPASKLTACTREKMIADCRLFLSLTGPLSPDMYTEQTKNGIYDQAGHDFWFTRNGDGVGFWESEWEQETGERLTQLSRSRLFGEFSLWLDEEGVINHG